ncbi:MAG: hypothetical protein ACI39R_03135 [Lachnospiraceae bacterium]
MNKDVLRCGIGVGTILILYMLIVFLIPFKKTPVFWVSFSFTLIAFGIAVISVYIAFIKNSDVRSRFFGFPVARIGIIYGIVQLIVGLLLMGVGPWVPSWIAVLLCAIMLGVVVISLIGTETVVDTIRILDDKQQNNLTFMHSLQLKINQMAGVCDEPSLKKLVDEIRYSDPVSGDSLRDIEAELSVAIDKLQVVVVEGNREVVNQLCGKITGILEERNRLCKMNKHQTIRATQLKRSPVNGKTLRRSTKR